MISLGATLKKAVVLGGGGGLPDHNFRSKNKTFIFAFAEAQLRVLTAELTIFLVEEMVSDVA